MELSLFFRGMGIGLLFGVPVGAVGAMTAQRTMNYGVGAGLLTGLGSSAADCFYALVGVGGFTVLSELLLKYQFCISLAGGGLILLMGLSLMFPGRKKEADGKAPAERESHSKAPGCGAMFLSSFAVGITNPAAILSFLFAFSWFGIQGNLGGGDGCLLVCGVFAGTFFWWVLLSGGVALLCRKTGVRHQKRLNRFFGAVLTVFALVVFVRACS